MLFCGRRRCTTRRRREERIPKGMGRPTPSSIEGELEILSIMSSSSIPSSVSAFQVPHHRPACPPVLEQATAKASLLLAGRHVALPVLAAILLFIQELASAGSDGLLALGGCVANVAVCPRNTRGFAGFPRLFLPLPREVSLCLMGVLFLLVGGLERWCSFAEGASRSWRSP